MWCVRLVNKRSLWSWGAIVLLVVPGVGARAGAPTLADCERAALSRNGALEAGRLDADALDASASAARRGGQPEFRLRSSLRDTAVPEPLVPVTNPGVLPTIDDAFGEVRLEMVLPLSSGGRVAASSRQAQALAQGRRLAATRSSQEILFEVRRSVARSLALRAVVQSLDSSAAALRRHLVAVEHRQAQGRATRTEVLRLRSRLASVEEERSAAENERRTALTRLEAVTGLEVADVTGELDEPGPPPADVEGLVERAMERRPDLGSLRAVGESARAEGAGVRAEGRARVDLVGGYGLRSALHEDDDEAVGSVAVEVTLPLFDGGRRRARRRAAEFKSDAARARLRDAAAWVRADVTTTVRSLDSARGRCRASVVSLEAARGAHEAAEAAWEAGRTSVAEVLDAEAEVREAARRRATALADALEAQARLTLALGEEVGP